jgi:hypothetical protein
MRRLRAAGLAVLVLGPILLCAQPNPPLSVVVSPPYQIVKKGQSVLLQLTLKNQSNGTVAFSDSNPACDYPMKIRDADGNEPPETAIKRRSHCGGTPDVAARNIKIVLEAGQSFSDQVNVSDYYDLQRTGTYTVQIFRHLPANMNGQDVPANSAKVFVTE